MGKSAARLFIILLTFAALLRTAQFENLDEAFYITAFVMFLQAFFNTLECFENEEGEVRFWVSVCSFASSVIGAFICYGDIWKRTIHQLDSNGWHIIIIVALFLAYFRLVLEDILPFRNLYRKIKSKQETAG